MKKRNSLKFALLLNTLCILGMLGCKQGDAPEPSQADLSSPTIVSVNGQRITEDMLNFTMTEMFGENNASLELRQSVIESLIATKAMSSAVAKQLDAETLAYIEQKVTAFKEELLVKEFLKQNVTPTPVDTSMVRHYYQQHPEEFGAAEQLNLELAIQPADTTDQQRQLLFEQLDSLQNQQDWSASTPLFKQLNLMFKSEVVVKNVLTKELQAAVNGLSIGSTSMPTIVNGDIYLLRLLSKHRLPPKPLSEVSVDIRKRLAPIQLKKAVKEASNIATNAATIKWHNAPQQ